MAVTLYSCLDAGAPQVTPNTAGGLISVLDACLVNGYGAKSPLGWTKPFTGTNLAAYRQAGGAQRYLRVDDTGTSNTSVTMYETMSAISTGTNPAPASGTCYIPSSKSASFIYWELLGDGKRFYLLSVGALASAAAFDPSARGSNNDAGIFFFGDIISYLPADQYACTIGAGTLAGGSYTSVTACSGNLTQRNNGLWACRNYQGTAAISPLGVVQHHGLTPGLYLGANTNAASLAFPGMNGELYYSPVLLTEYVSAAYHVRGHFPGLWSPAGNNPFNHGEVINGVGAHAGKTFRVWQSYGATTLMETSDTWGG